MSRPCLSGHPPSSYETLPGIKRVMLISMFAWVFDSGCLDSVIRCGASGCWFYPWWYMVWHWLLQHFRFFVVELEAKPQDRASAQGLFFIMTNGRAVIEGRIYQRCCCSGRILRIRSGMLVSRDYLTIWVYIYRARTGHRHFVTVVVSNTNIYGGKKIE